mmetsp:Transcript_29055/g.56831  ORF Transcript_29055/g.56831 Transcript_29055/m.56831 type:complete len:214 (-) Transcript_29055:1508-2149(-)
MLRSLTSSGIPPAVSAVLRELDTSTPARAAYRRPSGGVLASPGYMPSKFRRLTPGEVSLAARKRGYSVALNHSGDASYRTSALTLTVALSIGLLSNPPGRGGVCLLKSVADAADPGSVATSTYVNSICHPPRCPPLPGGTYHSVQSAWSAGSPRRSVLHWDALRAVTNSTRTTAQLQSLDEVHSPQVTACAGLLKDDVTATLLTTASGRSIKA